VTAPTPGSASLDWLVKGYRRALARFDATEHQREPEERFIPLFEALNWAVVILDFSRKRGPSITEDDVTFALWFARNRVHHQWADALEARDVPDPPGMTVRAVGQGSRIVAPPTVVDWFWRPLSQIPAAPAKHADPDGEKKYTGHLEGKPARQALAHLDGLLPDRPCCASMLAAFEQRTGDEVATARDQQ
jgi:hypothetical protein